MWLREQLSTRLTLILHSLVNPLEPQLRVLVAVVVSDQLGKVVTLVQLSVLQCFTCSLIPQVVNQFFVHLTRSVVKGIQSRGNGDKAHAHCYACNQAKEYKQQYAFGL